MRLIKYIVLILLTCFLSMELEARAVYQKGSQINFINGIVIKYDYQFIPTTSCYDHISDINKYYKKDIFDQYLQGAYFTLAAVNFNTLIDQSKAFSPTLSTTTAYVISNLELNKPSSCTLQPAPMSITLGSTCYPAISNGYPNACGTSFYYVGFKFVKSGLTYYGWVKMQGLYPVEAAYESIPGYPITVGDTKGFANPDPLFNTIKGCVYYDVNSNCTKDVAEKGIGNILVRSGVYYSITDADGNYELYTPSSALSLQVNIDTVVYNKLTYQKICPAPAVLLQATFTAGGNQTLTGKNFSVMPKDPVNEITIASSRRRRCWRGATYVTYQNLSLTTTSCTVKVVMPEYVVALSSTPAWGSQSGDTLIYSIPSVGAFSKGYITIVDSVKCLNDLLNVVQCTEAFINSQSISTTNWDLSDVTTSAVCLNDTTTIEIKNVGTGDMSDSAVYNILLDNIIIKQAKYKLVSAASFEIEVPTLGSAIRVEAYQTSNHPEITYRSSSLEGCGNFATQNISKNIIVNLPVDNNGMKHAVSCLKIVDSFDPNEKEATPGGVGANHEILPNGDIVYTIRFQNEGSDNAYSVVVIDTLSANLDATTAHVLGSSHSCSMELSGSTTKRLLFTFPGINLVPKSTNDPLSQGFVTFKIAQNGNLSNGTMINNKAEIFFDYNEAVVTNFTTHTINDSYAKNLLHIISQSQSSPVCEDASISLNVSAEGPFPPKYQWYKDNNELSGKTSEVLEIVNADNSYEGNYVCRVVSLIDTVYSAQVALDVQTCTGVLDARSDNSMQLYPNPASDFIVIKSNQKCSISIVNSKGQLVVKDAMFGGEEQKVISIESLASGLYTVLLNENNTSHTLQFVKK